MLPCSSYCIACLVIFSAASLIYHSFTAYGYARKQKSGQNDDKHRDNISRNECLSTCVACCIKGCKTTVLSAS